MSKSMSSPTAQLLRNSRIFSLPKPLPPPVVLPSATGQFRNSDTATLPYPTHQAIATPYTSAKRGDWGLKRPLPAKGTRSGTPVRVLAQDTYTHITDFESAGDHVRSLEKWAEMNIPMVKRNERTTMSGAGSRRTNFGVYEEDMDNTDRYWDMGQTEKVMHSQGRWKYDGPWVASMTEGEFKLYMNKQVSKRRTEWRKYLGSKLAQLKFAEARQTALNDGEIESFVSSKTLEDFRPDELRITEFEQDLRKEHADDNLTSALTKLLVEFLDLPALQSDRKLSSKDDKKNIMAAVTQQLGIGDINTGPPSTHPGAGLSHIRTSAVLENHPLHGPQAHKSPVLSRVLAPRSSSHGNIQQARLGVGGFVALDPQTARFAPDKYSKSSAATPAGPAQEYDPEEMSKHFDFDRKGGNKMWVHPEYASIDEDSRIRLAVSRADQEAVAVKTGDVQYIHDAKAAADQIGGGSYGSAASRFATGGREARPANYGYSLPDMRRMLDQQKADSQGTNAGSAGLRRRPQVEGLDAELARPGAGGNEAAQRIKELMEGKQ